MYKIEFEQINLDWIDEPKFIHKSVEINYSKIPGAGLGIIAKEKIKKGTFLGNYMGIIRDVMDMELRHNEYVQSGLRRSGKIHIFDAKDIEKSNYIRYINCSNNYESENVIKVNCFGDMPLLVNGKLYSDKFSNENDYIFTKSNGKEVNLDGYVICFALRDINKNEELYHNYNLQKGSNGLLHSGVKKYNPVRVYPHPHKSVVIIGTSELVRTGPPNAYWSEANAYLADND